MGIFDYIEPYSTYFILALVVIQIVQTFFLIHVNMKYNRLKRTYSSFMKGKDGKTLEERVMEIFGKIEEARKESDNIREEIRNIEKKIKKHYQKVGIVRYNAFEGMEGNLSFALTVLDENDNGWLFDSMNTERENHNFIKEIIKGESYIELTDEEKESLERAIFQEVYDIRYMDNLP
ncbi:MAG: DUF4446 family protein [Ruminococcus sp.]|nr:DUF4446 family protein [Ruminococcus sp.]